MKKKPPQKVAPPAKPREWCVGDLCMRPPMLGTYAITHVSPDGKEVHLRMVRTNFELFRVPIGMIEPVE